MNFSFLFLLSFFIGHFQILSSIHSSVDNKTETILLRPQLLSIALICCFETFITNIQLLLTEECSDE